MDYSDPDDGPALAYGQDDDQSGDSDVDANDAEMVDAAISDGDDEDISLDGNVLVRATLAVSHTLLTQRPDLLLTAGYVGQARCQQRVYPVCRIHSFVYVLVCVCAQFVCA